MNSPRENANGNAQPIPMLSTRLRAFMDRFKLARDQMADVFERRGEPSITAMMSRRKLQPHMLLYAHELSLGVAMRPGAYFPRNSGRIFRWQTGEFYHETCNSCSCRYCYGLLWVVSPRARVA
jgi:hypothetical protein